MQRDGLASVEPTGADPRAIDLRQEAIAELGRRLEQDPADARTRAKLAALLLEDGREVAALRVCNGAPEAPQHEPLLRLAVRAAAAAYRPRAGLHWLRLLVAQRPDDVQARVALGDTYALLGAVPASLKEFRRAAALMPGDEACRQRIAVTEERIAAMEGGAARYAAALAAGASPGGTGASTYLVTFGTADLAQHQAYVNRTAVAFGGIDGLVPWTQERLAATAFFDDHRDILSAATGAGYWLWRPYIILDLLERVRDGDWVVYSDVGRTHPFALYHDVEPMMGWAIAANGGLVPGVYIPDCGPNGTWTKRDCFVRMGCDAERLWTAPQIQASFSLWQKNEASLDFVRQWLGYCCDPAILTDAPNVSGRPDLPGFVEHRRDQSVLTNLALLREVRAFGSPTHPIAPASRLKSLDTAIRLALKGEGMGAPV